MLTSLPTVEDVLDRHASELGHDLTAYRNHEIEAMIDDHHKITSSRPDPRSLVESFRRADWTDVTLPRGRTKAFIDGSWN